MKDSFNLGRPTFDINVPFREAGETHRETLLTCSNVSVYAILAVIQSPTIPSIAISESCDNISQNVIANLKANLPQ